VKLVGYYVNEAYNLYGSLSSLFVGLDTHLMVLEPARLSRTVPIHGGKLQQKMYDTTSSARHYYTANTTTNPAITFHD